MQQASWFADNVAAARINLADWDAAQAANKGQLKVVGQTFSTENYGVGLPKGDTALCQKVTDAINKWISSGEWQKAVEKNLGPSGFKPGAGNPPKPAACGASSGATG